MKILHFCPLPLYSGLEQYALTMARLQRDRGNEIEFVVLEGSILEKEAPKAGLKTHVLSQSDSNSIFSKARRYKSILANISAVDVIHLHTSSDIKPMALVMAGMKRSNGRANGRPKLIQQNHIWISHGKRDPLHWLAYRALDEIWCSSEPAKRDLIRFLPVPSSKIHVVKYGRDLKVEGAWLDRAAAREKLRLPAEATVLGAIARIDKGKGVWELINGSIEPLRAHPGLHLVIIGGPTMSDPLSIVFAKEVEAFIESLPEAVRTRIHLTGAIPDAANLLRAFDIYAQVSYKETFSLALLDAQLAALPVLGTNSGGTPEVVKEGATGWLCEPENIESLRNALERGLKDRTRWKAFGATAQARVKREFDLDIVIEDILSRYQVR